MTEQCEEPREALERMMRERVLLEDSLRQSIRELELLGVTPGESLVDAEGYPRADLDLHRIRSLRASIARTVTRYGGVEVY